MAVGAYAVAFWCYHAFRPCFGAAFSFTAVLLVGPVDAAACLVPLQLGSLCDACSSSPHSGKSLPAYPPPFLAFDFCALLSGLPRKCYVSVVEIRRFF